MSDLDRAAELIAKVEADGLPETVEQSRSTERAAWLTERYLQLGVARLLLGQSERADEFDADVRPANERRAEQVAQINAAILVEAKRQSDAQERIAFAVEALLERGAL